MDAKAYLSQVKKLDLLIKNRLIERQQWRDIALCITSNLGGEHVQSSGSKTKTADAVDRYVSLEADIDKSVDQFIDIKKEVIKTIEELENVWEYQVLHLKYIQYKTFEEIAEGMSKSYTAVTTLHGRALVSVQKILDNR